MQSFVLGIGPVELILGVYITFLSFAAAIIGGYAVYVDANRRGNPNAVLVGLLIGFFTLFAIIPGFLALLLYMYGQSTD